jgi:hypothetical protein
MREAQEARACDFRPAIRVGGCLPYTVAFDISTIRRFPNHERSNLKVSVRDA